MAKVDFDTMELAALRALRAELDAAITRKLAADKAAMKTRVESMLSEAGLGLKDVMGLAKRRRPRVVRYRDPENPDNVWGGRGRMPEWLWEYTNAGRSKEEFEVEREVVPHVNGAAT